MGSRPGSGPKPVASHRLLNKYDAAGVTEIYYGHVQTKIASVIIRCPSLIKISGICRKTGDDRTRRDRANVNTNQASRQNHPGLLYADTRERMGVAPLLAGQPLVWIRSLTKLRPARSPPNPNAPTPGILFRVTTMLATPNGCSASPGNYQVTQTIVICIMYSIISFG